MRTHSTDMVSLVAGVIFLGVAGSWALRRADLFASLRGWLIPALLIGVGLIGLIGIRPRRRDEAVDAVGTDWTSENSPVPMTDEGSTES